jgi:hypothetical protein
VRRSILDQAMQRSDDSSARGGSLLPILLAFVVLSAAIGVLSFLTLGFIGLILAMALALAAFIASQYLLWGWWLGPWIARRENAQNDADSSEFPQK